MLRVVIASEQSELVSRIVSELTRHGYEALRANNDCEALKLIFEEQPEFVVLDELLPPLGGSRICRWIKLEHMLAEVPVLMLCKTKESLENGNGSNLCADDYLIGEFSMQTLVNRIDQLHNSRLLGDLATILKIGDIEMSPDRWIVHLSGSPLHLTVKEYRLLQELLEAKGSVLHRDTLLERVWGYDKGLNIHTRTVDVHMSRLRNKLGPSGNHIVTIRNIGYRMDTYG